MIEACQCCVPSEDNPGFKLGVILGDAWKAGRDKATVLTSPSIDTFADWVEQLIAESTGKEGKGIVPVVHEPVGDASVYGSNGGSDRLFVYMYLDGEFDPALDTRLKLLEAEGQPVIRIALGGKPDIGQEIVRWQVAAATAAAVMGINPFEQPNVEESKYNTGRLLGEYCATGYLPSETLGLSSGDILLYGRQLDSSLESSMESFLNQAIPARDYIAIMVFLEHTREADRLLEAIRLYLRDRLKVATTLGYGPRFLHSTGQLYKGGPNNGLFIQITGEDALDLLIPGEAYSFVTLKNAQALGDIQSLEARGRRVVRIHLAGGALLALARLQTLIENALAGGRRVGSAAAH